jgi:tripartite-type tricarboxylate transporter receptor subunit TctC
MGRNIPGNPEFVVQNMPGAGSMIAANYVYGVAKPDGLTLAAFYHALYLDQLAGRSEVRFDFGRWMWIGSPAREHHLLYVRADTPYRSMDDVREARVRPKCGVTGTASSGHYLTRLFDETLGARFDLVSGYLAGSDIDLAVERGEVQCRASTIAGYFSRGSRSPSSPRTPVRVLVQTGRHRDPRLPDVPTIYELMDRHRTADGPRRLSAAVLAAEEFGRPIAAPPGVPEERVRVLRDAFDRAVADPRLRSDAARRQLEIDPTPAVELGALAREVMAAPPELVERLTRLLGP